jgi:Brp/Blh family beta-carotene 15,15'-monooxygenase
MINNINKINFNISIIFLFFALLLVFLEYFNLLSKSFLPTITCLFLILTIGMSHGSLDHLKGYKVLKYYKINNIFLFYISYIFLACIIITVWIFKPTLMLALFLIFASYHFGKEDSWGENNSLFIPFELSYFLKGSLIVWLPLWLSFDKTLMLFDTLGIKNQEFYNLLIFLSDNNFFPFLVSLSFLISITLNIETGSSKFKYLPDVIAVYALYATFNPLIAFTIYFCFLHSVRHSACLINDMKINLVSFIKKAWPLTMLTAILFFGSIYILTGFQKVDIDSSIINVIFIGLASLTFPHILLEYLLEKNEKKRN